jgi:hypothetical protein
MPNNVGSSKQHYAIVHHAAAAVSTGFDARHQLVRHKMRMEL